MTSLILPGSTIGVLGNGQLGRMMVIEAKRMGYTTVVFGPGTNSPAGQVADVEMEADYTDTSALESFARQCDVVTLEFENVPTSALETVAKHAPVHPGAYVLQVAQNRIREKTTFKDAGLPVTPFRAVFDREDLDKAVEKLGLPAVLKTAEDGYDGKGQFMIKEQSQLDEAYAAMGGKQAILEAFVTFEREVSVVAARNAGGEVKCYPVVENSHANHILDVTMAPAEESVDIMQRAEEIAKTVLNEIDAIGVICVEFFLTAEGSLLINEIAPRPHNSGHWTIEGAVTSQYEQQVRAVCGLPLGDCSIVKPSAMANLLGDVWDNGEPDWRSMMGVFRDVKLHLYGKTEAKAGRKMGHLTVLAETNAKAAETVRAAREILKGK